MPLPKLVAAGVSVLLYCMYSAAMGQVRWCWSSLAELTFSETRRDTAEELLLSWIAIVKFLGYVAGIYKMRVMSKKTRLRETKSTDALALDWIQEMIPFLKEEGDRDSESISVRYL